MENLRLAAFAGAVFALASCDARPDVFRVHAFVAREASPIRIPHVATCTVPRAFALEPCRTARAPLNRLELDQVRRLERVTFRDVERVEVSLRRTEDKLSRRPRWSRTLQAIDAAGIDEIRFDDSGYRRALQQGADELRVLLVLEKKGYVFILKARGQTQDHPTGYGSPV